MKTYKMDIEKDLLQTEVGQGTLKSLYGGGGDKKSKGNNPTTKQRRKHQGGGFFSRLFHLGKGTTSKNTRRRSKNCLKRHADTGECMDQDLV